MFSISFSSLRCLSFKAMILNVEIVVICYMHYYRYRYCYYYILLVPIEQLYCPQALISTPPAEIRPWERGYSSELVNLSAIVYFAWSPHQSHARATPGNSPIHMFSFMNMMCTKLETKFSKEYQSEVKYGKFMHFGIDEKGPLPSLLSAMLLLFLILMTHKFTCWTS